MKKYIFMMVLLFISSVALASIFPPNCICEITAKVLSVKEYISGYRVDKEKRKATHVEMMIEILKIGPMVRSGYSPDMTCDQYKIGERLKVHAIKERDFVNEKAVIKKNAVIRGNIEYSGDERGSWYNFDKIEIVIEQ